MEAISAYYQIYNDFEPIEVTKKLELCGRVCYKSEDKITDDSAQNFIKTIIKNGHESVLEHASVTVKFVCDRGVSHELVRHRVASFSQESTRYCNYAKKGLTFIIPTNTNYDKNFFETWKNHMKLCEKTYLDMIEQGVPPEKARSVLPNSLKTEVIVTANLREWRHILKLRTSPKAHPDMRHLMLPLLSDLSELFPGVFDDVNRF